MFPLVQEMAAPGARIRVPVAVACRVLGFTKQAYYQWVKQPLSAREIADAQIIQVLRELHEDDPEGGYRVLADDLHDLGFVISERRVWRLCKIAGIQSTITTRKRRYQKAGAPVGDDLVQRDFTADGLDEKWLVDITEHWTGEGKLYLCAFKDGRIQRASATPSLGGCYGGFVGATVHRVFNAAFRLVSTNHSETFQREYRCGCRLGQACRHGYSHGRSGRYRTSGGLWHPKGSAISVVSTTWAAPVVRSAQYVSRFLLTGGCRIERTRPG